MKFDVITLFPEIIENYCSVSVIGRAFKQEIISVNIVNPRDFSTDKHKKVDDTPYGGGAGMVMRADVIDNEPSAPVPYLLVAEIAAATTFGCVANPR